MGATSAPWIDRGAVYVAHRPDRDGKPGRPTGEPVERTARLGAERGELACAWPVKEAPYLDKRWGAKRKEASLLADAAVGFGSAPAAAKLGDAEGLIGGGTGSGSWRGGRTVDGERHLTAPAVANDRVWAGTWGGSICCWDARSGHERWIVPVGAPCHWQPVVAAGWVYAGLEDGSLVGFETGDPGDDGWPMWGGGAGHNGAVA